MSGDQTQSSVTTRGIKALVREALKARQKDVMGYVVEYLNYSDFLPTVVEFVAQTIEDLERSADTVCLTHSELYFGRLSLALDVYSVSIEHWVKRKRSLGLILPSTTPRGPSRISNETIAGLGIGSQRWLEHRIPDLVKRIVSLRKSKHFESTLQPLRADCERSALRLLQHSYPLHGNLEILLSLVPLVDPSVIPAVVDLPAKIDKGNIGWTEEVFRPLVAQLIANDDLARAGALEIALDSWQK